MSKSCLVRPVIRNKQGEEVTSKLYEDAYKYINDKVHNKEQARNMAWKVWAVAKSSPEELFSNPKKDANGEYTFSSVKNALNLDDLISGDSISTESKTKAGEINSEGESITYTNFNEALNKANTFNNDNSKELATVYKKTANTYGIKVYPKSKRINEEHQELIFSNALNNQLHNILKSLGFDVIFDDNLPMQVHGMFDPTKGKKTLEGLTVAIKVARGELGEEAFPEEVAHLFIEGLATTPLVQRLLGTLNNEEVIRKILGNEFEKYNAIYEGNMELLIKEAAGKLLYQCITGNPEIKSFKAKNLLERLWEYIKNLIHNNHVDNDMISSIIDTAMENASGIAMSIKSGAVIDLIDTDAIMNAHPMYQVATKPVQEKVNRLQKLCDDAYLLSARKMKIVADKTNGGKYKWQDLKTLKQMQKDIDDKAYSRGCVTFLNDALANINDIKSRIDSIKNSSLAESSMIKIKRKSAVLNDINDFLNAYTDIINQMKRISMICNEEGIDIATNTANNIEALASQIDNIMGSVRDAYNSLKMDTMLDFLKQYWNGDITIKGADGTENVLTLQMILERATKDIGFMDKFFSSMGDCSDPLLSLVDKAYKTSRSRRDQRLEEYAYELKAVDKKLRNAGYSSDFMLEKTPEGKLTGKFITHIPEFKANGEMTGNRYSINWDRFRQAKANFARQCKEQGKAWWEVQGELEKWEQENTELVYVDANRVRQERMPIDKYRVPSSYKLSKEQEEYYDAVITMKAGLDNGLQNAGTHVFFAPQVRNDTVEGIRNNLGNPAKLAKFISNKLADNFVRREDDVEFGVVNHNGEYEKLLTKEIRLDMSGNPIEQLPVYYTTKLYNMDRLSTDITSSMMAYSGMAINFSEMNKIIDALELIRHHATSQGGREVLQKSGNANLMETQKILGKAVNTLYSKSGNQTNIGNKFDDYFSAVLYGKKKAEGKTVELPFEKNGKKVQMDIEKTLDALKTYSGIVGLGLNVFSAISNITVGKMQMWIEAAGGEYFGFKNLAKGGKDYYALLPAYLAEINSTTKSSKRSLLIDKFDALEEFYNNLKEKGYYKGPVSRIIGNTSVFILNNLGEHYLHVRTMLAMLDRIKVKVGNEESTLYNAFADVTKATDGGVNIGGKLFFKEGTTTENGEALFTEKMYNRLNELLSKTQKTGDDNAEILKLQGIKEFTNNYITNIKLQIGKINQSLNGAFNEDDKGAIHRHALGRLLMQFRQWMPAHYGRRFGGKRYDAILGEREGYYRTFGRVMTGILKDLVRMKFNYASLKESLSPHEKANLKKALFEIGMFLVLAGLISLAGKPDDDDTWGEKQLKYQLRRMKLETGASCPIIFTSFFDNMWSIMKSPIPAVDKVDSLIDIVQFWKMNDEIQRGRYKGWSKWERDTFKAIPLASNIKNVYDFVEDDFMFKMFDE